MKKNMKLFVILKLEYGEGEENVFPTILNVTSSKSTAEAFKEHYEAEFADEIHASHSGRWVSIRMHQCLIQLDDEIIAPDMFIRFIEGSDRSVKESF